MGNEQYWSAELVNYSVDLQKMLALDIIAEQKAIGQYINHQNHIDDINIKKLLDRIILDEKLHLKCFKTLYINLDRIRT
ncbi:MAG: ferritin family protein [Clostridia bacterium]|nr:ferritin family protein [Clostridia bacterium]MDD4375629.1 ferritin family protein [Clostridia bacterium]